MSTTLGEVEAIIWDFDGALVDSLPGIAHGVGETITAMGQPARTPEEIRGMLGGGARQIFTMLFGESHPDLVEPALAHFHEHYPRLSTHGVTAYPGVPEALAQLARTKKLAIVTAKMRAATFAVLDKLGLAQYFDLVVSADDVTRMKPDPEGINKVLEELGVAPERAVFIGDMKTDVAAGRAAGVHAVGVTWGYGARADLVLAEPDLLVDSVPEFMEALGSA
ncbi:HAD family hydrolase [Propionibacteriaceae bacterium Y1923]|uniref:HAD family hydrolase n=1 Tax=Aestuariimicrobium sp. Y1814 TaxID=3418742 RepID=UPI003C21128A